MTRRLADVLAHCFDAEVVSGEPIHPDGDATAWILDRQRDEIRVGRRTAATRGFTAEVRRASALLGGD